MMALSSAPGADTRQTAAREEVRFASREVAPGLGRIDLSIPGIHCAGCIRTVERGLAALPEVQDVRVNLSTKRASVTWRGDAPPDLLAALDRLGFTGHLAEPEEAASDPEFGRLVRALAVAGFSAMNIMLLSVSVWSGADPATRQAFHWISAALALPCLVYSGRIFFTSAWAALRHGRTSMDVPISVGVVLAFGLSLYDTLHNGPHAYFDAATSLIFFLLIGRTLDHVMRERARTAVRGLARLSPRGATVLLGDGRREYRPVEAIEPGLRLLIAAGDRIPVDGIVAEGRSDLDCALATGESAPRPVAPGSAVQAGMLNLAGPLTLVASARASDSFLAEMLRLMEAAEGGRARYRRIADRAAALYSPVVHTAALLTFAGWMIATGDVHRALTVAIAVLIITCPCGLGLAVPIVQVMAARRLFESGIMVRDGSAIERLAEIDTVAFDKTGTLTLGRPRLVGSHAIPGPALAAVAALAQRSNHPLSQAVALSFGPSEAVVADVVEQPGLGIEGVFEGSRYRLGRAEWALYPASAATEPGTIATRDGKLLARFDFTDVLRPNAHETVAALREIASRVLVLSGDEPRAVAATAAALGIGEAAAGLLPADKVGRLGQLSDEGARVLMVGDGLNDAPALAAAHVSMAPASAADIGRNAADFVFLREGLEAIPKALAIAREAGRLVRQNFGLSIAYNAVALPIAVAGYVTPLIAALGMSLSSIVVVVNALRLGTPPSPSPGVAAGPGRASRSPALEPGE